MIHAPLPRIRILVETEESWPPARPSSEVLSPSSTWEALVPAQAEPPNTPDDFATWYMQQQFAEENKTRARLSRRQSFIPSPRNMQNAQVRKTASMTPHPLISTPTARRTPSSSSLHTTAPPCPRMARPRETSRSHDSQTQSSLPTTCTRLQDSQEFLPRESTEEEEEQESLLKASRLLETDSVSCHQGHFLSLPTSDTLTDPIFPSLDTRTTHSFTDHCSHLAPPLRIFPSRPIALVGLG